MAQRNDNQHKIDKPSEPFDFFDYVAPERVPTKLARPRSARKPRTQRRRTVVGDWPQPMPLYEEEVRIWDAYFAEWLDDKLG